MDVRRRFRVEGEMNRSTGEGGRGGGRVLFVAVTSGFIVVSPVVWVGVSEESERREVGGDSVGGGIRGASTTGRGGGGCDPPSGRPPNGFMMMTLSRRESVLLYYISSLDCFRVSFPTVSVISFLNSLSKSFFHWLEEVVLFFFSSLFFLLLPRSLFSTFWHSKNEKNGLCSFLDFYHRKDEFPGNFFFAFFFSLCFFST